MCVSSLVDLAHAARIGERLNIEPVALSDVRRYRGYARYIAICRAGWKYGASTDEMHHVPLPKQEKVSHWNTARGIRARKWSKPHLFK